mmetsp:Transcript_20027/g.46364  ORF Transcript_20027/g.46364 Transcript_20027/m.46364 type:complete len:208 (-) Transcript_20027:1088-1711(-)
MPWRSTVTHAPVLRRGKDSSHLRRCSLAWVGVRRMSASCSIAFWLRTKSSNERRWCGLTVLSSAPRSLRKRSMAEYCSTSSVHISHLGLVNFFTRPGTLRPHMDSRASNASLPCEAMKSPGRVLSGVLMMFTFSHCTKKSGSRSSTRLAGALKSTPSPVTLASSSARVGCFSSSCVLFAGGFFPASTARWAARALRIFSFSRISFRS